MKKNLLSVLLLLLLPLGSAPAQQLVNNPKFQGTAQSDIDLGAHAVKNGSAGSGFAVPWGNLTGKPTSLAGYGIADSVATYLTGQAFCFEGDSITAGSGPGISPTTVFPYYLASKPFLSGRGTYHNSAVGGSTIAGAASRYAASVHPHRPAANGGDGGPKAWLFLLLGTNDLNQGRTDAQIVADLNTYIATAHADGFTVVAATIPPRSDGQAGSLFTAGGNYRLSVNQSIRDGTVAADLVVDLADFLPDPTNTAYYLDNVHPTVAANMLIASFYNGVLSKNGAPDSVVTRVFDGDRIVDGALGALGLVTVTTSVGGCPLRIQNTDGTQFSAIRFDKYNSTGISYGGYVGYANPSAPIWAGQMVLMSADAATPLVLGANLTERMRISTGGRVLVGTTSDDGSSALQVGGTATAAAFSGGGAALTALNASSLASGTVADARLSANVPLLGAAANPFAGRLLCGGAADDGTSVLQTNGTAALNGPVILGIPMANYASYGHASFTAPDGHTPPVAAAAADASTSLGNAAAILDVANSQAAGTRVTEVFSQYNGNGNYTGVGYVSVVTPGTGGGFRTGEMAFGVGNGSSGQFEVFRATHAGNVLVGTATDDGLERLQVAGALKASHLVGGGGTPTVSAGSGAGTSPAVSLSGTDVSGILTVTTGTSPAASSAIAAATFAAAYGAAPVPVLSPANAATAALAAGAAPVATATTTTLTLTANGTALAASTAYKWYYHLAQ